MGTYVMGVKRYELTDASSAANHAISAPGSLRTVASKTVFPSVNNANGGAFQRHVVSGILFHGRPSMMLGAGPTPAAGVDETIILKDGHPTSSAVGLQTARYPIERIANPCPDKPGHLSDTFQSLSK